MVSENNSQILSDWLLKDITGYTSRNLQLVTKEHPNVQRS